MVTGDNVKTAKAIALECGILSSLADVTERSVIEGKTFRALSDSEREEIAESISVGLSTMTCSCALIDIHYKRILSNRLWEGHLPMINCCWCKP